mgnify:CR=1 FL=1
MPSFLVIKFLGVFARNLGGNFRGMKETNKEFKTPKVKKKRNQQKTVLILFRLCSICFYQSINCFYFIVATFFPL